MSATSLCYSDAEKRKEGMQISGPLDARHVGGMQNIMHLTNPLAQQSRFNVEVSKWTQDANNYHWGDFLYHSF